MMESGRPGGETTGGVFVPGPEMQVRDSRPWAEPEITAPGTVPQASDQAPAAEVFATADIQPISDMTGPEAIDPVTAEHTLARQSVAIWPTRIAMYDLIRAKSRNTYDDFYELVRRQPGANQGHYGRLEAELQVLQFTMSESDPEAVMAITDVLQPVIDRGKMLEPVVATAAIQEISEQRAWLADRADWESVIGTYIATMPAEGEWRDYRAYHSLAFGVQQIGRRPMSLHTDYEELLHTRDTLRRLSEDITTHGHIRPSDQPWIAPEGWTPKHELGAEIKQWLDGVEIARKFLAAPRMSVYRDDSLRQVRLLTLFGDAAGLGPEGGIGPQELPPQFMYAMERWTADAQQRFEAADAAVIAEITAALPESVLVTDPHGISPLLGISNPDTWVATELAALPDHMKQGLRSIQFAPAAEAKTYAHNGHTVIPDATFISEENEIILYVDTKRVELYADVARHGGPQTAAMFQRFQEDARRVKGLCLRHEIGHFDHSYKAPIAVLADWVNAVAGETGPLTPYTAHAAEADAPLDPDLEEYATATQMYADVPESLKTAGNGARYPAMQRRFQTPGNA